MRDLLQLSDFSLKPLIDLQMNPSPIENQLLSTTCNLSQVANSYLDALEVFALGFKEFLGIL